jgi:hypothetical protein
MLAFPDDKGSGARTLTAYMLVPKTEDFTDLLCKVSVTDDAGKVFSYVYNLTGDADTETANDDLLPENVYNFSATLAEDKWAGSNIYWNGTKLTFDEPYEMGKSAAQGLFFKWGGLTGISPVEAWWSETCYIFTDTENTGVEWDDIPAYADETNDGDPLPLEQDICYQISKGTYRMPTSAQLNELSSPLYYDPIGSIDTGLTTTAVAGTEAIKIGVLRNNQVYLPLSGYRSAGLLLRVGYDFDNIWSSTAKDATSAYVLNGAANKVEAYPIRCIKAN